MNRDQQKYMELCKAGGSEREALWAIAIELSGIKQAVIESSDDHVDRLKSTIADLGTSLGSG